MLPYETSNMARTAVTVVCLLICVHYGEVLVSQALTEEEEIHNLKQTIESLGRQLMTQQLFVEERIRSDGDSGIKTVNLKDEGSRPYIANSYVLNTPANLFDNFYTQRYLSAGPFDAVMNGVDFKVSKLFYSLKQPSSKNKNYNALEDIPFPDVPPSVKSKPTVMEQIKEMKQYFKAFKNQDPHIRADYEKYFKPVLCYLEAGWTRDVRSNDISSHLNNVLRWSNAMRSARFLMNSGDYTFLPTVRPIKIIDIKNGIPEYAKWNYRAACHQIKYNLRRSDFTLVDDLSSRLRRFKTYGQYAMTTAARFRVTGIHGRHYDKNSGIAWEPRRQYGMEILDYIMQEIPGKDNYPGYLNDESFGLYHDNLAYKNNTRLNTAYYHRMYKVERKDAMGGSIVHRGFTDNNMWTAQTSNPNIVEMKAQDCQYNRTIHKRVCKEVSSRYTYAIPLEIVWMSPLLAWNPFEINYFEGDTRRSPANVVNANGRNGGFSYAKALNGTNEHYFVKTPYEFFNRGVVGNNSRHGMGVLDKHGVLRSVVQSGTRMFLNIPDVGMIRMRYPIMPIHDEGNTVYKELDALKEIAMDFMLFGKYAEASTIQETQELHPGIGRDEQFQLSTTFVDPPGMHNHDVDITPEQRIDLYNNLTITAFTSMNNEHQHQVDIQRDSDGHYVIKSCDGQASCSDGHNNTLYRQTPGA